MKRPEDVHISDFVKFHTTCELIASCCTCAVRLPIGYSVSAYMYYNGSEIKGFATEDQINQVRAFDSDF